jgi:hypothetical protein
MSDNLVSEKNIIGEDDIITFKTLMISPLTNLKSLNYHDALLYCSLLDINGYADWRMPDIDDMNIIQSYLHEQLGTSSYWLSDKRILRAGGIVQQVTNEEVLEVIFMVRPVRTICPLL